MTAAAASPSRAANRTRPTAILTTTTEGPIGLMLLFLDSDTGLELDRIVLERVSRAEVRAHLKLPANASLYEPRRVPLALADDFASRQKALVPLHGVTCLIRERTPPPLTSTEALPLGTWVLELYARAAVTTMADGEGIAMSLLRTLSYARTTMSPKLRVVPRGESGYLVGVMLEVLDEDLDSALLGSAELLGRGYELEDIGTSVVWNRPVENGNAPRAMTSARLVVRPKGELFIPN